jgi:hypothetical protein
MIIVVGGEVTAEVYDPKWWNLWAKLRWWRAKRRHLDLHLDLAGGQHINAIVLGRAQRVMLGGRKSRS